MIESQLRLDRLKILLPAAGWIGQKFQKRSSLMMTALQTLWELEGWTARLECIPAVLVQLKIT